MPHSSVVGETRVRGRSRLEGLIHAEGGGRCTGLIQHAPMVRAVPKRWLAVALFPGAVSDQLSVCGEQ
eukprot:1837409-Alexandrium_andersonii.AAC.1